MQRAYSRTIPQWAGRGVWRQFDRIRLELGLNWDDVAFTNLAKCHVPAGVKDDTRRITSCLAAFPIDAFIEMLEPIAVFVAKDSIRVNGCAPISREYDGRYIVHRFSNHWSSDISAILAGLRDRYTALRQLHGWPYRL
jgi:hypothetical protein